MDALINVDFVKKLSFVSSENVHDAARYTLSDLNPVLRVNRKMSENLQQNFTIEVATEKDSEEILSLLKTYFFKDEPLNTFIELGECKELEEYSLKCIPQKCSFKAVNSSGEIIGVLLNGVVKRPSNLEPPVKHAEKCAHPKFRKILAMMDYIDENFNIFDLYPDASEVIEGKIISVNINYRGLGIAGKLIEKTIEYMRQHSIRIMLVLCSSHFSARVLEKLSFQEVYKLAYEDYVVEGQVVFKPEKPHVAARILVKEA